MTARERSILIAGLGAVALIVGVAKVAPAAATLLRQANEDVAERIFAIERLQHGLARRSSLADSLSRLEGAMGSLSDRLLMGVNESEAQLGLRRRLSTLAAPFSVRIDSIETPQTADPPPDTIAADPVSGPLVSAIARAFIASDLEGVVRLVDALEADPVLWIARMDLRLAAAGGPQSGQSLTLRLDYGGWWLSR